MDLESVLMFPLFLYSIRPLLHFLRPLLGLLLHLRSHGVAHLLLHLARLVHHVLRLLLLRRGHMTLAHHGLTGPRRATAAPVHVAALHLGRQNAGEGELSYDPNNHNFPSHDSLLYCSTGKIIFTRRWLSLATKRLSPFGT